MRWCYRPVLSLLQKAFLIYTEPASRNERRVFNQYYNNQGIHPFSFPLHLLVARAPASTSSPCTKYGEPAAAAF